MSWQAKVATIARVDSAVSLQFPFRNVDLQYLSRGFRQILDIGFDAKSVGIPELS